MEKNKVIISFLFIGLFLIENNINFNAYFSSNWISLNFANAQERGEQKKIGNI